MTLLQLKYVVEVAAAGTISGAARMLHMTQPPLYCTAEPHGGDQGTGA